MDAKSSSCLHEICVATAVCICTVAYPEQSVEQRQIAVTASQLVTSYCCLCLYGSIVRAIKQIEPKTHDQVRPVTGGNRREGVGNNIS